MKVIRPAVVTPFQFHTKGWPFEVTKTLLKTAWPVDVASSVGPTIEDRPKRPQGEGVVLDGQQRAHLADHEGSRVEAKRFDKLASNINDDVRFFRPLSALNKPWL